MKTVTLWEKLKLQIDNLELMAEQHKNGKDVSTSVYWQVEYIHEILEGVEQHLGGNEIRNVYNSSPLVKFEDTQPIPKEIEVIVNTSDTTDTIEVFTDGGCRGNGKENNLGAWAYTLDYNGEIYEKSEAVENTTNNIQELTACIEALKYLTGAKANINIYSDSAYVVNGMNEWVKGWKAKGWKKSKGEILNLALWKELDRLAISFPNIQFHKVKGHSDDTGNQRADYLVNKAMDDFN